MSRKATTLVQMSLILLEMLEGQALFHALVVKTEKACGLLAAKQKAS